MSESETYSRTHRSTNRLAQFGLYKYDSTEPLYKPRNERYRFGVVFLLSLLLTFLLVLFFLIITLSQDEEDLPVHRTLLNTLASDKIDDDQESVEAVVVPTNSPWQPQIHFESDIEEQNFSEADSEGGQNSNPPSPQAQKLIFFPSRELQPPKIPPQRVKVVQKRRRSDMRRVMQPHSFMQGHKRGTGRPLLIRHPTSYPTAIMRYYDPNNHLTYPDPLTFEETINNDNEPFRPLTPNQIAVVGKFRRPKNTTPLPAATFVPTDPFYKYKPRSPDEVNQLLYDRSQLSIGDDRMPRDPEMVYNNMVTAGRYRSASKLNLQRGDQSRNKPFQLMLDVYPMAEDQQLSSTTIRPGRKRQRRPGYGRFSPYAAQYNAQNAVRLEKNYFNPANHFNTMRFAQIAPQNPYSPLYNDPHYREKVLLQKYENDSQPSQLVVHLNLYPKNKKKKNKKKGSETEHEENNTEFFRRSDEGVDSSSETEEDDGPTTTRKDATDIDSTTHPVSINFNINSTPGSSGKSQTGDFQPINSDDKLVSYGPPAVPVVIHDAELTTYRPSRRPSFPFQIHQPTSVLQKRISSKMISSPRSTGDLIDRLAVIKEN